MDDRVHQVKQAIITTLQLIKESIDWFANFLFDTTVAGGRIRRWLFIIMAGFIWALTARSGLDLHANYDFFLEPINTLFHAKTLRHVLVAGLAFWLALKVAAIYLDDVFELDDPEIAERYILQASLANRFPKIEIKDGLVQEDEDSTDDIPPADSTIVRIGGPGLVRVHYDSAALFEKFNGEPTVIIAEDEQVALDRFERLRKVVRLRDHIEETEITTRTRDGIPVSAKGIRVKYHLLRYRDFPGLEGIPYPVVREAVEKLVYGERVSKRLAPLGMEPPPKKKPLEAQPSHTETLNLSPGPITSELKKYINTKTLSEFLAAISEPELNQRVEDSQKLDHDALEISGEIQVDDGKPGKTSEPPKFQPRSVITDTIKSNFEKNTRLASGLDLNWIDIGTWVLPPNAERIVKEHEKAWRKSLDNLKARSEGALSRSENISKVKTTRALLQEIIYEFRTLEEPATEEEIICALLNQYHKKLGLAIDIYQKRTRAKTKPLSITRIQHINLADEPDDDERLSSLNQINKTFAYLSILLNLYKTGNGDTTKEV